MLIQWNGLNKSIGRSVFTLLIVLLVSGFGSQAKADQGEAISVPNHSVRYYGMMVRTESGVRGRIIINDVHVEQFGLSGSQISSNQPQCFLRVGENTLIIDLEHVAESRVENGGRKVIKLDLHAMDKPDFPSEDNLFFSIGWSPEKPAQKKYRFVLTNNQKPAKTAICG